MQQQRHSSPIESFSNPLIGHQNATHECLVRVQARLEKGSQSKYVTRFTEKNLLTHRCMARFRKVAQYYTSYLEGTNVVSLNEDDKVIAKSLQDNMQQELHDEMVTTFEKAIQLENDAFTSLVHRVEEGTKLVEVGCPFKEKFGEQMAANLVNPRSLE